MHARRHIRATRLAVALAAPFALLLALPTTAHAASLLPSPGLTAPDAVVRSLQPGGDAFKEAVDLDATGQDGTADPTSMTPETTRFGRIHLGLSFDPATESTSAELTADDVTVTDWLAIEYREGKPTASIELEPDGSFACLGGCRLPVELADATESLPDDVAILAAGVPVHSEEVFALSADRRTVTPLNDDATTLVGPEPVSFAAFRTAAVKELKTWLAAQPTDLPADAIGGVGDPDDAVAAPAPRTHLSLGAFVGRLALIVVPLAALAFVLEERRRARREPTA